MNDQIRADGVHSARAADSFYLGTLFQAACSRATACRNRSLAGNFSGQSRQDSRLRTRFARPRRLPAGKPALPARCRRRTKKRDGGKPALSRGTLESRRRSAKLAAEEIFDDQTPPRPLDLVDPAAAQQLGWPFSLVLPDPQLEAEANSALYEVTTSRGGRGTTAPVDVTFHWSDGHLDVTKKLTFTPGLPVDGGVHGDVDGKAVPVAVAWRGGFGDRAVYKRRNS